MGHVMDQQQQNKASLNCPRCNSTNTKFCYYNNYSLSQPRHFCKACKRYWTRGGTLRSVPVGGGCRKNNKRAKIPTSSIPTSSNQVSQVPTCTLPSAVETPSNLCTPSFYSRYKDMIPPQQCNIFSDMNVNNNSDIPTDAFFSCFNNHMVEYLSLQNAAHPLSVLAACQANTNTNDQASQLLEWSLTSQAMQQVQVEQQPSCTVANYSHHRNQEDQQAAQGWNTSHVDHAHHNNSSMSRGGTRNVTPWPPNHLTNMDG